MRYNAHKRNTPVRVKWINDLKDANGNFLPHLLPVDPTLHWANPPGGTTGRDMRPDFSGKTYVPLSDFTRSIHTVYAVHRSSADSNARSRRGRRGR